MADKILLLVHRHEVQRRGLQESRGLVTLDDRWGVLRNADQFLISMQGPLREETLQRVKGVLNDHGGWLSSYIPDSSVLGIGPSTSAEALRNVPGVLWVVSPFPSLAPVSGYRICLLTTKYPVMEIVIDKGIFLV